ncbi:MAG: ABC transporter ATP-binding protein [Bacteroidota bacterium]
MKLEIFDLAKTYSNGVQALKDVSLTIKTGMFGLLGQNGAGKSTLMKTIAALQDADKGSIFFNDIDVDKEPDKLRQILGYLPQEFGVYPTATATELLTHIADMKGITVATERKEQVEALLKRVNLWDARNKKLGGYSGGMKQRFGIAQALLGNPQLIIVDEPTAGLDPMERNRFYNLLSEIGENTVVILSTHIVEDVSTLCNQMAIIGEGEVLLTGTPSDVAMALEGKVWEKEINSAELEEFEKSMNVISNHFHMGQLLITVVADAVPGPGFEAKHPTLEDAYFNVLKGNSARQLAHSY